MSNYLDSIPQAVATIVTAFVPRFGGVKTEEDFESLEARIINFADHLTRTLAKALVDAESGKL